MLSDAYLTAISSSTPLNILLDFGFFNIPDLSSINLLSSTDNCLVLLTFPEQLDLINENIYENYFIDLGIDKALYKKLRQNIKIKTGNGNVMEKVVFALITNHYIHKSR